MTSYDKHKAIERARVVDEVTDAFVDALVDQVSKLADEVAFEKSLVSSLTDIVDAQDDALAGLMDELVKAQTPVEAYVPQVEKIQITLDPGQFADMEVTFLDQNFLILNWHRIDGVSSIFRPQSTGKGNEYVIYYMPTEGWLSALITTIEGVPW
jgi:hypothetical protein